MHSLRARLTLSYAILVATILAIVVGALTVVVTEILKRPLADEIAAATRTARTIVATASPAQPTYEVQQQIVRSVSRPGLFVFPLPPMPPGVRPPPGPPPGPPLLRLDLRSVFEPEPARIIVRDRLIIIGADPHRINWAITAYLEMMGLAIAAVIAVAWLVAAWITRQAIAPLLDVTTRLEQFAGGNFIPQPLDTEDRSEIGGLIAAYNGAAAQVATAFAERALVEEHMRRFVADAGHELRTPLSVIAGALEVLRKGALDDLSLRDRLFRSLGTETQRMDALVERLISLARLERPEHPEPEPIDIVELTTDAIAAVRAARGGEIALTSAPTAIAFADQGDVYDALGNLIDNAVKYGDGSRVSIEITVAPNAVVVSVSDGGPGIPPGDRPHIFDRFYRGWLARNEGGSGLGLSIARRAIERAGGILELRSGEPGRTTFAFTLPRPDSGASATLNSPSSPARSQPHSRPAARVD